VRRGYGSRVPAAGHVRGCVASYAPRDRDRDRDRVRRATDDLAARLKRDAVRYQGNWFPHRLRSAIEDGVFFVGDAAGHCLARSGEGIRPALYCACSATSV